MTKSLAVLLSGTAALITISATAGAATPRAVPAPVAQSYAELLEPISNAVPLLQADEARRTEAPARVQTVQYHHHHHHHHGFFPGIVVPAPYYAAAPARCYWTRGPAYWNGWRWVRRPVRVCD